MASKASRESRERYTNRYAAGQVLARHLQHLVGQSDVVVLGLPRGGVPVASEVAHVLGAPLDIFVVRKLGVPQQPELAMGAIASGGIRVLNHDVIDALHVPWQSVEAVTHEQGQELSWRERVFRNGRRPFALANRTVVLVDDGLATGSTMRAAVKAVRELRPSRIVVAVPVASTSARDDLCALADEVICPLVPASFHAVGEWYDDFAETSDAEVRCLLGLPAEVPTATQQVG
jgi:putative phosphoribosyl transferase